MARLLGVLGAVTVPLWLLAPTAVAQPDNEDVAEVPDPDAEPEPDAEPIAEPDPEPEPDEDEKKPTGAGEENEDDDKPTGTGEDARSWGHDGNVPDEPKPDAISGEHRWDVHLLEFMTFSVGFLGQAGAVFLDKPNDQTINGGQPEPEYPGYAGLSTGIGPTFEVRFLGYVGIELDLMFQSDEGSADLTVRQNNNRSDFTTEIGQSALHMPLLIKGALPGKIITPVVFLGPEFVFPSEVRDEIIEGTIPGFHNVQYRAADPGGYTAFMFGLGLEFNLNIPYVDVRIPFNLRGTYNPGVSDKRAERETRTGNNPVIVETRTEFQFQAVANLGLSVHF